MIEIDLNDPKTLVGRTILVGITYLNKDGSVARQTQYFGTIRAIENMNITIEGDNGSPQPNIPYDVRALSKAARGQYLLRATGEVIEDPDILSTWTVTPQLDG